MIWKDYPKLSEMASYSKLAWASKSPPPPGGIGLSDWNGTDTVDGVINGAYKQWSLYPGRLVSGIILSLANGWAYIQWGMGRGALKWDFMVWILFNKVTLICKFYHRKN